MMQQRDLAEQTEQNSFSMASVADRIARLDLEPIKVKLMDSEEGEGWTLERADEAEAWYKRYLYLCVKYDNQALVPAGDIDLIWHQHILDTRKYARDCDDIFGGFLHHFPYFGMRGEEDAVALKRASENTLSLFNEEFGQTPFAGTEHCKSCKKCTLCIVGPSCRNSISSPFDGKNVGIDVDTRPTLNRV